MSADAQATLRIKTVMDSSDAISNVSQLQKRLESLKLPKNLTEKAQAGFDELKKTAREYQELVDKPKKSNADLNRIDQLSSQMKKQFADVEKYIRNIDLSKIDYSKLDSPKLDEVRNKIEEIINSCKRLAKDAFQGAGLTNDLNKPIGKLKELQNIADKMTARKGKRLFEGLIGDIETGDIDAVVAKVKEIETYMNQQKGASKQFKEYAEAKPIIEALLNTFREMKPSLDEINSYAGQAAKEIDHLGEEFNEVGRAELDKVGAEMREIGDYTNQAAHATNTWANSLGTAAHKQTEMQQQVQNLQQQIKNYFGLDEVFRKIGDLAREAMDTVKELDAAMTETAVVTNFDVGDMWKMLPTYTKNANALGSTIADVYNAATLYYQQGLTTSQSMDLANETLKMARIGGIEAAEATDMMTAALRGFNMEINQTSAQRINDVYSKLAAITAADTKEIGLAMERTASIASSANMDFETTSAFLAQMIETTREAPENLGTAMKTIIARFQELKVDPNTLIDSEGEALDYNRVDKALKTVGISLLNNENEFRKLDDVYLEIASRWDTMTQAQQRYIATQAAGSRQQSRFIAMMQDYGRTQELVEAAYTAKGAGQAQFEKTLESMDSKLNKLKNAWDQFVMGLMNAQFLKKGVDIATSFLGIVEKVIDTISKIGVVDPFKGLIKSALTATTVFGGLLGMSKLLVAAVGKFAGFALGEEAADSQGFMGAAYRSTQSAPPVDKQTIEQNRALAKQAADTYNKTYYEQRAAGATRFQASRFANQEKSNLLKGERRSRTSLVKFDTQFTRPFEEQMGKLDLSDEGQNAAQRFIEGFRKKVANGGKVSAKEFEDALAKLNTRGKLTNKDGEQVKIGIDPAQINGMGQITNKFDAIGNSARNAGTSIQSFASTLYGTPLQPFGQALDLLGRGMQGIGQLAQGASAGMKALAGAAISDTIATAGDVAVKTVFGVALETQTAEQTLAAIAAYAEATGQTVEAAAVELSTAALNGNLESLVANTAGLDANTAATIVNGEAHLAQAGKATKGIKGLFKGGFTKISSVLTKIPPQFALIAAAAIAATAFIAYFSTKSSRELEKAKNAAAQAGQDLDTAKQALEAVVNDLDELKNNDDALDNLVKGTTEWNNKLAEANAHIIEMMGNYESLNKINAAGEYEYIKTDKDGRMSITQAGQEALRKEYQNAVNVATANNAIQGAYYNNLKDKNSDEWKKNKGIINTYERFGVGNEEDYKRAKLQNENISQTNDARLENAWKTGIHAAIADSGLGDTSAVENILTDQRKDLVKDITLGSKAENKRAYAEAIDYEYVKGDTYKDAQGNKIEIDYKTVKDMLPEIKAIQSAQNKAPSIQESLGNAQDRYTETITTNDKLKELQVEGYDKVIEDILSSNEDANLDAVEAFIRAGDNEKSGLEAFAKTFEKRSDENDKILSDLTGMDITSDSDYEKALKQFKTVLQDKANALIEQQTENMSAIAGVLETADWGKPEGKTDATQEENIKAVINKMSAEQRNSLAKISEDMADNLSRATAENYATTVANLVDSGKGAAADKLQNALVNVDFSSAISTLEGLRKVSKSADADVSQFGKNWLKTSEAANTTATALQDVYESDDFGELADDMNDYIKEQGKLDSTKIMEMAESSQSLDRYLKATGASTEGVARAFTLLAKGKYTITDLTGSVVAVANEIDRLAANIGKADKAIKKLETKNDTGRFEDSLSDASDRLDEYVKNGEFGNEDLENILSTAFGPEAWAKAYRNGEAGIQSLIDKFKGLENISPNSIQKLLDDLPKGKKNADELIQAIKGKYKIKDDDVASMIMWSATNKDVKLKRSLETTDMPYVAKKGLTASGVLKEDEKGNTSLQQGRFISKDDIIKQAQLFDTKQEGMNFIAEQAKQLGVSSETIKAIQEAGTVKGAAGVLASSSGYVVGGKADMTGEEIVKAFDRNYKAQRDDNEQYTRGTEKREATWWEQAGKEKDGSIDLKAVSGVVQESGYDQTQSIEASRQIAKEQLEAAKKNGEAAKTFKVGSHEFTEEEIKDPQKFQEAWQEAIDQQQWSAVGKTIGEEIVAAMERANLDNKIGNVKDRYGSAFGGAETHGKNNISDIGLDYVYKTASEGTNNPTLIAQEVGSYLKQSRDDFGNLNADQKYDAINSLVNKMNEWNFTPEQMTRAINDGLGTNLNPSQFTGKKGEIALTLGKDDLTDQLKDLGAKLPVEGEITTITFGGKSINADVSSRVGGSIANRASGQNNHRFGTFARGSRGGYTIPGRPTLTGEEGEELVWEPKQNKAYMVGSNGPQFANISRNAIVWNAAQTKRIKKNSGSVGRFGTSSKGIKNFGTMDGGTRIGASAREMAGKGSGGSGAASFGTIPLTGSIEDVIPPKEPKTIPVYADVKVKGEEKGGLWNKIKSLVGGKDKTKTIPVTAQITKTVNKTKKSVKGIKATATVTKVKKTKTVSGEPVKVKAKATVNTVAKTENASGAISDLASKANSVQTMTVDAKTEAAKNKVRNLVDSINSQKASVKVSASPGSLEVPVKLVYDGSWSKTITFKKAAEGMNYKKYNSYASGTPKAKGGLTLTGEEGYEVVWMPGQKQSMIVGTKGPQMLELPSDAVVWPHDQSKKILKNNKGVPAQSYAKGSSKKKYKPKAADKYGVYKTVPSEQKFFKWIAAVEKSEKNIEKWGKSLDKASEAMDRYAKYVGGDSKALFNSKVTEQFNLLSKQLKAANSELTNAKKLTSAINNSRKKESISVTKHSGPDAGSRNVRYSQGKLVNRNKKTGELSINESYIRSVAGSKYTKGKKKGKRKYNTYEANQIMTEMRSAAQSLVDEYNGHLDSAKDLQDEVKQKQQELRDSIKETFYEFEHDLDRIKELQSNISLFDSFESRVSAIQSYLDSKMKAGFATSKQVVGQYTKFLAQQADNLLDKITAQRDLTTLTVQSLSNDTKTYDEYKAWKNAQSATAKAKKHGVNSSQYQKALAEEEYRKQEYDRVVLGSKYVKVGKDSRTGQITVTLKEDALAKANLKSEDYQAVKDYYENILQKVQDINQGVADVHSGIASAYDQITNAYADVDNFAKNVINGMQESEQETIDSLKTLNESLRDAFSDLIDNVRKELDKQRKAEQNQKTEKDITDKMNRLAMLRADTSGSNAAEIAQLEKEITEATGDYEDSLEDQLLDRLQDDADKAAEQRERQISILEEQLEYTKAIGQYVTRAENLVQKYINGTATAAEQAELRSYYMLGANGKDPMTKWAKWLAEGEFESAATKVKTFNSTIEKLTNTIKSLEEVLANLKTNPVIGDTKAQQAEQLAGQMKKAGKSAQEVYSKLKEKGLNDSQIAKELRKAGYTGAQAAAIKDLSAKELRAGGYSAKDLAGSKSAKTLLKAGYTYKEIAPYYSEKTLQKAAADTGTTNKAKDFGGGKTKLSGTTKTVTNYKNKKGKAVNIKDTTGTFTEGGSVAFAKGSQVWYKNSKTGKITKKYPLNKFTKAQISPKNAEYKEFAQAIKFAMTNNKVGSKVPGLVTALKTAISTGAWKKAGYNKGWALKGAKVKGSAGSNGLIYYNSGDAVKTWNPSSGDIKTIKYNKADFAKKAALTYVGREYANAREYHKKKYKKYLSGGLANYTGPAWMDGTPSKPELVLNATDTKNFMALKDVLSEATKRGAFSRKEENISQGDMTFDININVDKIDSDYDVDKVAKRVEKIITTKAKTRNVTVVGRSR